MWFTALPAGIGMLLLAEPLARVLFERGEFTAEDSSRAASMIAAYASGVWAYCAIPVLVRGFYAVGDSPTPAKIGLLAVGLNLCSTWRSSGRWPSGVWPWRLPWLPGCKSCCWRPGFRGPAAHWPGGSCSRRWPAARLRPRRCQFRLLRFAPRVSGRRWHGTRAASDAAWHEHCSGHRGLSDCGGAIGHAAS